MSILHNFNPGRKSWKMYANTITSISGDDLTISPYDGKNIILEVSGNNEIIFKKGDVSYNLADLSNVASGGSEGGISVDNNNNIISSTDGTGIPSGSNNIFLGQNAGNANNNISTSGNIFIGYDAAKNKFNTDDNNIVIGTNAVSSINYLFNNIVIGNNALFNITAWNNNNYITNGLIIGNKAGGVRFGHTVVIGTEADYGNDRQAYGVCIGYRAGYNSWSNESVVIGASTNIDCGASNYLKFNVIIGNNAATKRNTIGSVAIGYQSQRRTTATTHTDYNTSIGYRTLYNNTSCNGTSTLGANSGYSNPGDYSTYLGFNAGYDGGDFNNTIVINSNSAVLNPTQSDSFFVKPIRNVSGITTALFYDISSGEITYDSAGSGIQNGDDASFQNVDISGTMKISGLLDMSANINMNYNKIIFSASDDTILPADSGIIQKVQDLSNTVTNNLINNYLDASFGNVDICGNLLIDGNISISGNIIPTVDNTFDLGSPEFNFKDLYLSANSLWIGDEIKIGLNSNGTLDFRKRVKSSVPNSVSSVTSLTESTVVDYVLGSGSYSSGSRYQHMKLKHWKRYLRDHTNISINGKSGNSINIEDIFNTSNDSDWQSIHQNLAAGSGITVSGGLISLDSTSNVTFNNITSNGTITSSGNIIANSFIGDGSQLSGITINLKNYDDASFGNVDISGTLKVDNISEKTDGSGITIDNVLIKDNTITTNGSGSKITINNLNSNNDGTQNTYSETEINSKLSDIIWCPYQGNTYGNDNADFDTSPDGFSGTWNNNLFDSYDRGIGSSIYLPAHNGNPDRLRVFARYNAYRDFDLENFKWMGTSYTTFTAAEGDFGKNVYNEQYDRYLIIEHSRISREGTYVGGFTEINRDLSIFQSTRYLNNNSSEDKAFVDITLNKNNNKAYCAIIYGSANNSWLDTSNSMLGIYNFADRSITFNTTAGITLGTNAPSNITNYGLNLLTRLCYISTLDKFIFLNYYGALDNMQLVDSEENNFAFIKVFSRQETFSNIDTTLSWPNTSDPSNPYTFDIQSHALDSDGNPGFNIYNIQFVEDLNVLACLGVVNNLNVFIMFLEVTNTGFGNYNIIPIGNHNSSRLWFWSHHLLWIPELKRFTFMVHNSEYKLSSSSFSHNSAYDNTTTIDLVYNNIPLTTSNIFNITSADFSIKFGYQTSPYAIHGANVSHNYGGAMIWIPKYGTLFGSVGGLRDPITNSGQVSYYFLNRPTTNMTIPYSTTTSRVFYIQNNIDISGDLNVSNNIVATGRLDVNSDVSLNGNVDISGDLNVSNNIVATGRFDLYGDASFNNVDISGNVTINSVYIKSNVTDFTNSMAITNHNFSSINGAINNTFFGYDSGASLITGDSNVGIGTASLYSNNSGYNNVAIGHESLMNNTSGNNNIGIGYRSLFTVGSGTNNIAIGSETLESSNGNYNIAIGSKALEPNISGWRNVAMGYNSMLSATGGSDCVAIGFESLKSSTNGEHNVAVGAYAGDNLTTGDYNVYIGHSCKGSNGTNNNEIAIGRNVIGNGTNTVTIGADDNIAHYLGKALIGNLGHNNYAGFSYRGLDSSSYALLQDNNGGTRINAKNGQIIYFFINNNSNNGFTFNGTTLDMNNKIISNVSTLNNVYINSGTTNFTNSLCITGHNFSSITSNNNGATIVGIDAGKSLSTGIYNVAYGYRCLENITTGNSNVGVGMKAGNTVTTESYNIAIGESALLFIQGHKNIGLGTGSGRDNRSGCNNNIYIGVDCQNTNSSRTNITNEIVIGTNASGNGTNTVTIGNSSITNNYFNGAINANKLIADVIESSSGTRNYLHQQSGDIMLDSEDYTTYKEFKIRGWINPDESDATGAGSTTGTRNEIFKARLYNTSISYLALYSKDFNWLIHNSNTNDCTLLGSQLKAQKEVRFYSQTTSREQNIKTGFEINNLSGNSTWHTIKSFTFNNTSSSQWNMGSVEVHCTIKQVNWEQPNGRLRAYRAFYFSDGTFYSGTLVKTDSNGLNSQAEFQLTRSGSTINLQYRCTNSNTTSISGTLEILGSNFNFYT